MQIYDSQPLPGSLSPTAPPGNEFFVLSKDESIHEFLMGGFDCDHSAPDHTAQAGFVSPSASLREIRCIPSVNP
jgi:hypothetical protein